MKKRNYLQKEVSGFVMDIVVKQLAENPIETFQLIDKFAIRTLSVSDIGIDRKLFHLWKTKGLLPFEQEKGWSRFSFIELCWLKLLVELRKIGIGIQKIQEIKEFFFEKDFVKKAFSKKPENPKLLHPDYVKQMDEKLKYNDGGLIITPEIKKVMEGMQISLFSFFLYATMLTRSNYCLYIDSTGRIDAFDLNQLMNDTISQLPKLFDNLSNQSVVMVNMKKIVADISGTHDYFTKTLQLDTLISEKSVQYLKQLFLDNQVKEVTIRVTENERPTVFLTRAMELSELQKEVYALRKKGSFRDIIVKTRNGNVQYFEKTDIIKL